MHRADEHDGGSGRVTAARSKHIPVIGIGGPVGSGKTALVEALCRALRDRYSLAVVTNDIFTKEDAEFLTKRGALPQDRILGVETGGSNVQFAVKGDDVYVLEVNPRASRTVPFVSKAIARPLARMRPTIRKRSMNCCAAIRMLISCSWKAVAITWPRPSVQNSWTTPSM